MAPLETVPQPEAEQNALKLQPMENRSAALAPACHGQPAQPPKLETVVADVTGCNVANFYSH